MPTNYYTVLDESGREYRGSAEEIVTQMHCLSFAPANDDQGYMNEVAERAFTQTEVEIDTSSATAFIEGMMNAGLLKPKKD